MICIKVHFNTHFNSLTPTVAIRVHL